MATMGVGQGGVEFSFLFFFLTLLLPHFPWKAERRCGSEEAELQLRCDSACFDSAQSREDVAAVADGGGGGSSSSGCTCALDRSVLYS